MISGATKGPSTNDACYDSRLLQPLSQAEREHFLSLTGLNHEFYARYASEFHDSRAYGWPAWNQVLDLTAQRALSVLDIGCGGGRLLSFLERQWVLGRQCSLKHFVGVDREPRLLKHAQEGEYQSSCEWLYWDWCGPLSLSESLSPLAEFDLITLFGVLHHVYHPLARLELILIAAERLAVEGTLAVSLWDFGDQARYTSKFLSWDPVIKRGLDPDLILPGDHLLGWRHQEDTPRYCHWMNPEREEELKALVSSKATNLSSPEVITHHRDGNRYLVWKRLF